MFLVCVVSDIRSTRCESVDGSLSGNQNSRDKICCSQEDHWLSITRVSYSFHHKVVMLLRLLSRLHPAGFLHKSQPNRPGVLYVQRSTFKYGDVGGAIVSFHH